MPDLGLLLPTGLVSSTAYPFTITIEGVGELAQSAIDYTSLVIEDTATDEANGVVSFRYWDPDLTKGVRHEAVLRVYDDTIDKLIFTGLVRSFHYEAAAVGRHVVIDQAVDCQVLLDELLVPLEVRPAGEGTAARIGYFWGHYARHPLALDMSLVSNVDSSLPADLFQNLTLRSAIRQVAEQSGSSVRFYVDAAGRPRVYSGSESDPGAAPFNVNVAVTPGSGNIAPTDLTASTEGPIFNRVYIRGATVEGSGWFQDDASVATYGPREHYIDAPSSDTAEKAQAIAQLQLGRTAQPRTRGGFSTLSPNDGWRAGQNITITSAQDGLSALATRIVKVRTRFTRGDAKRVYELEFSTSGARLAGVPSSGGLGTSIGVPGQIVQGSVVDDSGNMLITTAQDVTGGALGPALRRFLASGVYNGDFALTPPAADAAITTANKLPYWTFAEASGSAIKFASAADSASGSGRVIQIAMAAGATGDEAYLEQIVPVNASRDQAWVYRVTAAFVGITAAATGADPFVKIQYLRADGATTGSETIATAVNPPAGALRPATAITDVVPADAAFLRIRVGFRRDVASNSDTQTLALCEVTCLPGHAYVDIADTSSAPSGSATLSYANDVLVLDAGGVGGGAVTPTPKFRLPKGGVTIDDASDQIPPNWAYMELTTGISDVTITATPTIPDPSPDLPGHLLLIVNGGSQNITIQDEGTLANSNIRLVSATLTLGTMDSIIFLYNGTRWVEIARSNVV